MRALLNHKRFVLFISVLALGALAILAGSLEQVRFRGAEAFSLDFGQRETLSLPKIVLGPPETQIPLWQQLSALVLLVGVGILVSMLLSPELRKRLIRTMIRAACTYWLIYYLLQHYQLNLIDALAGGEAATGDSTSSSVPPAVFVPPQANSIIAYLISFGVAIVVLGLAFWLYRAWKQTHALGSQTAMQGIADVARNSLQDLNDGRNSSDVILNCYFRMSDVVAQKQHVTRNPAMTPSEFAVRLEQIGLPREAVQRLTHLFERVRYGGRKSGPGDVNEAVTCLTTILHYCGEAV